MKKSPQVTDMVEKGILSTVVRTLVCIMAVIPINFVVFMSLGGKGFRETSIHGNQDNDLWNTGNGL